MHKELKLKLKLKLKKGLKKPKKKKLQNGRKLTMTAWNWVTRVATNEVCVFRKT